MKIKSNISSRIKDFFSALMELRDTVEYSYSPKYKKSARRVWSQAPAGTHVAKAPHLTKEYFEEIRRFRYFSHPWIKKAIESFDIEGKRVLEIGVGAGTDHLQLAGRGANMFGVDITPRCIEETRALFDIYGMKTRLLIGDAESLPFEDESFDFVYSLGVLHHVPNTAKAISEVHRVLKKGGRCYIAVYNKRSIFFLWNVFALNYLIAGNYRVRTLKQHLSLIEYPHTNENLVVKLYTKRGFSRLFEDFSKVKAYVRHLVPADIAYVARVFRNRHKPNLLLDLIGRRVGWYIIVEAQK